MKQKKIYISGQMTGLNWKEVKAKFAEAEEILHDAGFRVFNPTSDKWQRTLRRVYKESIGKDVGFQGNPREHALICDLMTMINCDAVLLLDNWDESTGARAERTFAVAINKPVFNVYDELIEYYEQKETSKGHQK